jgi:hypothetical protein
MNDTLYFNVTEEKQQQEIHGADLVKLLRFVRKVGQVSMAIGCEPLAISVGPSILPEVWAEYAQVRIVSNSSPQVWRVHRVCAMREGEIIITFPEEMAKLAALVRSTSADRVLN